MGQQAKAVEKQRVVFQTEKQRVVKRLADPNVNLKRTYFHSSKHRHYRAKVKEISYLAETETPTNNFLAPTQELWDAEFFVLLTNIIVTKLNHIFQ